MLLSGDLKFLWLAAGCQAQRKATLKQSELKRVTNKAEIV